MINLKKLALALTVITFPTIAAAQTAGPVTFEFEGATWVVRNFGGASQRIIDNFRYAPVTRNMMTAGFGNFCRNHVIDLVKVPNTTGGAELKMTAGQKFRGDGRFHVVCAWGAPAYRAAEAPTAAAPPAVATAPVAPTPTPTTPPAQPQNDRVERAPAWPNTFPVQYRSVGEKI